MRTLPLDRVNQHLLTKQHLTPETRGMDVLQVVEDIVALHATAATTPYLSLWSRMDGFERQQFEAELYDKRTLVRVLCMRQTMFIVATQGMHVVFQAMRKRLHKQHTRQMHQLLVWAGLCAEGKEPETLQRLQDQVTGALADGEPRTVSELSNTVSELKASMQYNVGRTSGQLSVGSRLVPGMCTIGLLVRTRPRGTWRSNQHRYTSLATWLPDVDLDAVPPQHAQASLVRSYLTAFGPSTFEDIVWWSGFTKRDARRALTTLGSDVVECEIERLGAGYLMLTTDLDRVLASQLVTEPGVNLLPCLDPYIMGYQDRRRFLAPEHRDQVFDRSGNAFATVWVDGRVVGVWRDNRDEVIELLVWDNAEKGTLTEEAKRVGRFLCGKDVEVIVTSYPPDTYVRTPFALGKRR